MEKCKITESTHEYWDHNNVRRSYTVRQVDVPKSWPIWAEPNENGECHDGN